MNPPAAGRNPCGSPVVLHRTQEMIMIRKISLTALALVAALAASPFAAFAAPNPHATAAKPAPAGLASVLEPYETARLALVDDHLDGVATAAAALRKAAAAVAANPSPDATGVPAANAAELPTLLADLDKAAATLAGAQNLGGARAAFYAVSKPLVRWRTLAGAGPAVAYCSMEKKTWLQPTSEIGNPYAGKAMATCGEIVGK